VIIIHKGNSIYFFKLKNKNTGLVNYFYKASSLDFKTRFNKNFEQEVIIDALLTHKSYDSNLFLGYRQNTTDSGDYFYI